MTDAQVIDECIHRMTTAWCSICKQQSRSAEKRKRQSRTSNGDGWALHPSFPYPHTEASRPGSCDSCDDPIRFGDSIWHADGGWVCILCAEELATLGVGVDGTD